MHWVFQINFIKINKLGVEPSRYQKKEPFNISTRSAGVLNPRFPLNTETSLPSGQAGSAHGAGLDCLPNRKIQLTILNS